jgi:hypothetical protein
MVKYRESPPECGWRHQEKKCTTADEDAWKVTGILQNIPVSQDISFVMVQLNSSGQSLYRNRLSFVSETGPSVPGFTDPGYYSLMPKYRSYCRLPQ